ncbi:single-strand DNA endonuclease ASTE1-like [Odontesthes bonariensis]|uniref:single-strand DNA endonuclease ASTE1-like n=1 Tax=Odontesthes bonariensis TaxID=219752 RepID=UPI003F588A56
MGVRGLHKLIQESNILTDFEVSGSKVVIDGPGLYYHLYYRAEPKLDQRHGGDYSAFRDEVGRFFDALRRCDITPYVLLDGGHKPQKEETLKSRLRDKVSKATRLAEPGGERSRDEILPPLVKDVFIQLLRDRRVEFVQSSGEADLECALRANERKCPVLSDDSDFYIFHVQEGFLPLKEFQWKQVRDERIPAKRYRITDFCQRFQIRPRLMPVFAALTGNDYSRLQQAPLSQKDILKLLRTLTPDVEGESALREVLRFCSEEEIRPFLDSVTEYDLVEPAPPSLPRWMGDAVQTGILTSFVTSVMNHRTMMLTPLVENSSQPSSYTAALRIRQYFYGLLVGQQTCTEYDRDGKDITHRSISPVLAGVTIDDLQHLDKLGGRKVLHGALNLREPPTLEGIPDNLKLPVCVTIFWLGYRQQKHPGPWSAPVLQAILLGFVYGADDSDGEFKRRMRALRDEGGGSPLHSNNAHAFNQWQCCMRQSLHLNQLLSFPLPEPDCARLCCGPLLHRLAELEAETVTELQRLMDEEQRGLLEALREATETGGPWEVQKKKGGNGNKRKGADADAKTSPKKMKWS